ncbi:MAG: hypothetical protein ACI8RW_000091 [Porticoccaceae bacterium]|jgi:hypothetical protein
MNIKLLTLITLFSCSVFSASIALSKEGEAVYKSGKVTPFTCDMSASYQLCREYEIVATDESDIAQKYKMCSRRGGVPSERPCPRDNLIARCVDIVADYRAPHIIHTAYYYLSLDGIWDEHTSQRICAESGGEHYPADK